VRFADPDRSWAVLVGTASYDGPDLRDLPAVANNLRDFRAVLTDPQLGGLRAEHCVVVQDPSALPRLGVELASIAKQAEDTLIVYYAGHGLVDDRGALYLALRETDPGHVVYTALPLAWARQAVADSPARNRIIILDCCFSGRAIEAMASSSALVLGQIEIAGAYTLTSAPANETALAPIGARHTAFTGELLSILRGGIDGGSEGLALGDIYLELKRATMARGLPAPQQRNTATVDHLALVRNTAYRMAALSGQADPPPAAASASTPGQPVSIPLAARAGSGGLAHEAAAGAPWAAGVAAWQAGDVEAAERLLSHAVESAANTRAASAATVALGLLRRDGYRDLDAAEMLLARVAVSNDPPLAALARLHRGCVLELRGDVNRAEAEYRQIIDVPDADCAALAAVRLGWLLTDRGCTEEAERIFRAGYELGRSSARVWLALGLADALVQLERFDEAAGIYERVLATGDGEAKAFAALGARQLCLQSGLPSEAAEYAWQVVDNSAATSLWPTFLSDESPATSQGRIYAISKWLTWCRSHDGGSVCLADRANPRQFIFFDKSEFISMSVCIAPRILPRRRRGYAEEISCRLAAMGFEIEAREEGELPHDTESWIMNIQDKNDLTLATLSEEILADLLIGRPDFVLEVESEPVPESCPQPRPPMPDLLPY